MFYKLFSRKQKFVLLKIFGLFSVIRGYNIWLIAIAQYLSAIFILAPNKGALSVLTNFNFFIIVFASLLCIAAGYIINSFYDTKKDLINRPKKTMIDRLVSQKTKLNVYFSLNFFAVFISFLISWKATLFFSSYIFLLWFYSHKLKKFPIIGNLSAAILAILPFFAILVYYNSIPELLLNINHYKFKLIFFHAFYLFLILFIREIIKDLENFKGDFVNDYNTIPVKYGVRISKALIVFFTFLTIIPIYYLVTQYNVGYMDAYFYFSLLLLIYFLLKLYNAKEKSSYLKLHALLKLIIVLGVFSIILIKPEVLSAFNKLF